MTSIIRTINKFIPFADASRPLWQDAIYSLILCTFLYFAPQLSFTQIWQTIISTSQSTNFGQRLWPSDTSEEETRRDNADRNHATDGQSTQHIRPPAPTVEDDSDSDADSLDDDELAALIRDAEQQGALADPFAAGPAGPAPALGAHRVEQLLPPTDAATAQQPRRLRDPNRQVGAKKAKSLARRERIRAYHEFMREQGDMQRAQEASTAQERDKEIAEARARRAKVEAEIEERARRKREEKKKVEEERERQERQATSSALSMISDALAGPGRVEVRRVAEAVGRDVEWVAHLIRKEGMLDVKDGKDGKAIVLMTSKGWLVRVSEDDMRQLHDKASNYQGKVPGKVSWTEMNVLLDTILRKQHRLH